MYHDSMFQERERESMWGKGAVVGEGGCGGGRNQLFIKMKTRNENLRPQLNNFYQFKSHTNN